jgi:hypothetical protein
MMSLKFTQKPTVMKVQNFEAVLVGFNSKGELAGKFSHYRNYYNQLIPQTANAPCIFKVIVALTFTGDVSGRIDFKGECTFKIDTEADVPTAEFLHSLHLKAIALLQPILDKEVLEKTDINPIQMVPMTFEEAKASLEINIAEAYPVN